MVELPYEKDFEERNIPTKVCHIQINKNLSKFYNKEMQYLLAEKIY